jgi:hypothetical protein
MNYDLEWDKECRVIKNDLSFQSITVSYWSVIPGSESLKDSSAWGHPKLSTTSTSSPGRSNNVGAPTQNGLFFIFWLNRAKFDRACECPANGPAWSSMVPHVQHAGLCWNLLDHCWTLALAGICRTLRDTARGRGGDRRATPTITMASESILLRDTWYQRSLVIATSNTPPPTLSTCFRRGGGVFWCNTPFFTAT